MPVHDNAGEEEGGGLVEFWGKRQGERETGGQGDMETRRQGDMGRGVCWRSLQFNK